MTIIIIYDTLYDMKQITCELRTRFVPHSDSVRTSSKCCAVRFAKLEMEDNAHYFAVRPYMAPALLANPAEASPNPCIGLSIASRIPAFRDG